MTMTVGDTIFLSMIPKGGSGILGKVTGFASKYGIAYVTVESANGKTYSAPIEHAQEA